MAIRPVAADVKPRAKPDRAGRSFSQSPMFNSA